MHNSTRGRGCDNFLLTAIYGGLDQLATNDRLKGIHLIHLTCSTHHLSTPNRFHSKPMESSLALFSLDNFLFL